MTYSELPFHKFWERCGESHIHPSDQPFFDEYESEVKRIEEEKGIRHEKFLTKRYLPCPFDGPLYKAKVVVCLSNPNYPDPSNPEVEDNYAGVIKAQRSGCADLPHEFDSKYYKRIAKVLDLELDQIRELVSIFNVCPYASKKLEGLERRVAAGLPSVWAAQDHLRKELIPKALNGDIYLVIIRKHELWGVAERSEAKNLVVVRSRGIDGSMSEATGKQIKAWLKNKNFLKS